MKDPAARNNAVIKRRIGIVDEIDAAFEIPKNRIAKEMELEKIVEEDGPEKEESEEVVTNRD